jgi:hypothetical protein
MRRGRSHTGRVPLPFDHRLLILWGVPLGTVPTATTSRSTSVQHRASRRSPSVFR